MPRLWRCAAPAAKVQLGVTDRFWLLSATKSSAADLPLPEKLKGRNAMKKLSTILAGVAAAVLLSASAQAQVTLKASHQFPGGKGDVRDDMVQMIAKEAKAANVGLDIQVYPGASLFKPNEQWNAMVERPTRHHAVPARLRQRQGAGLQRDADAGPDPQPGPRQADQQLAVHEGRPRRDREARRDRAVRCLVRRRHGIQERLHRASRTT